MVVERPQCPPDTVVVAIAQIAPIWMNRERTLDRVVEYIGRAADEDCELVAFGEAVVPGYPFWIARADGARFDSRVQKDIHAHYMDQAVQIEAGHLQSVCDVAAARNIAVYVGCVERALDRGGHSLYCSLVYVDATGDIQSVHRKLMPTYEERLTWAPGDGHGLRVHQLGAFTVGGLNCWENWMPLARTALSAQGEDLHVAVWPGGVRNTSDITRFVAKEGRSFVISASAIMRREDASAESPHAHLCRDSFEDVLADGGSCIAGPDGEWVVEPVVGEERLVVAALNHQRVRAERQYFDPVGHYSRPDVTRLALNRERQGVITIEGT